MRRPHQYAKIRAPEHEERHIYQTLYEVLRALGEDPTRRFVCTNDRFVWISNTGQLNNLAPGIFEALLAGQLIRESTVNFHQHYDVYVLSAAGREAYQALPAHPAEGAAA